MAPHTALDTDTWYRHAFLNRLQSFLLIGIMAAFLGATGWLLWGPDGLTALLLAGTVLVFLNPVASPHLVMRLYHARRLKPAQAPMLYAALEQLARRAGLPATPTLYHVPSAMVNAFAVGTRRHAAIAVTDGLLRRLEPREVVGVLAHEISHVRNNDMWVMGLADMFSRLTSTLSLFGQILLILNLPLIMATGAGVNWAAILLLVFAPTLSALAQLGLSRTREFDADLNAVRLTGDPEGLARALAKIEQIQSSMLEHIFLPGRGIPEPSLLRTHPPTEERIRRLLELRRPPSADSLRLALPQERMLPSGLAAPVTRRPGWHVNGLWH